MELATCNLNGFPTHRVLRFYHYKSRRDRQQTKCELSRYCCTSDANDFETLSPLIHLGNGKTFVSRKLVGQGKSQSPTDPTISAQRLYVEKLALLDNFVSCGQAVRFGCYPRAKLFFCWQASDDMESGIPDTHHDQ